MVTNNGGYYANYVYHQGLCDKTTAKIVYFRDMTTFHCADFCCSNIQAIVINNTTVPTVNPNGDNFNSTDWVE
jgi:hypothetical protein